jgi:hypothetical protein
MLGIEEGAWVPGASVLGASRWGQLRRSVWKSPGPPSTKRLSIKAGAPKHPEHQGTDAASPVTWMPCLLSASGVVWHPPM